MVIDKTLVIFGKLDAADHGCTFAGNDRFHGQKFRLFLFGDMLVVTARGAPDEAVPGIGDDLVFSLVFALRAVNGDKH